MIARIPRAGGQGRTVLQVSMAKPPNVASSPAAFTDCISTSGATPRQWSLGRILALVVLLFAWALRFLFLDAQDIWWDEARNIQVASLPFAEIATAPELDIHPPVYFYGLHLWMRLAGASAFTTRLFSVWFGLLAIALSYRLGRGLGIGQHGRLVGLLTLVLAAFSPYALAEAQETRMYTLSWALLAAGALALWRATQPVPAGMSWRRWALFAMLAACSLLTHYSATLILTTWAIWLFLWALGSPDRRTRLRTLAFVGLATLMLCLPIAPIAWRQIPGYDNPNLNPPGLFNYLVQLYRAFTLGEYIPEGVWTVGRWLWLFFPFGGVVFAWRNAQTRPRVALLGLWLAGGLALYYGVLVRRSAFDPRYISFVLPPLWALAGWALAGWKRLTRALPWLFAVVLVGLSIPSLHADLTQPEHFHEDTRGVVAWLQAHATPQDIVLVDQRYPIGFYWQRWNNESYGFPPQQPADQSPAQYLFVDINRIDERLTELVRDVQRVYWVTWYESDTDPRGCVSALLDAHGTRGGEQSFRGYRVQWWQLQPPTRLRLVQEVQALHLRWEPGITLLEGDWLGRSVPAMTGQTALVTLRWRADGPTSRSLKVSVRLRGGDGAALAQDDRVLLNDLHQRTTSWHPEQNALAVYSLQLPAVPGIYELTLVVYDEATLEPLGLSDGSGVEVSIGTVRVE